MKNENGKAGFAFFYDGIIFIELDGEKTAIVYPNARRGTVASENAAEKMLEAGKIQEYLIPALYDGRIYLELVNGKTALDNPADNAAAHTPAPWALTIGAHSAAIHAGGTIAAVSDEMTAWRANAALMAAAPDLLAVLDEMLADAETMREPYRNEAICERARAAIAKAKGGAQ